MNYLYIITVLILFILACLLKKTKNKIDIIPTVILIFILIMVYQVLICWFFTLLSIKITLLSLSISNIFISIIIIFILIKKGIQKYSITIKDSIATLLLLFIMIGITYKDVGMVENIRYYSTDASIHYIAAKEFYQNEKMLFQTENTETFKQMMPMAYVNIGILFKALAPIIGQMNFYRIFVLFDIVIFYFSGLLFYFILKKKENKKSYFILAIIISIIYLCGYPLNNLLAGFFYLGIGCLIINSILWLFSLEKEEINKTTKRIILLLLNTGLIFSYALFAPAVYLSIFIYQIYYQYRTSKKIVIKEIIIDTIIELIIPGILGVIFLLFPNVQNIKCISIDGYIYKDLFINIFAFIPFVIYFCFKNIKEKKINYFIFFLLTLISYMIILYIGTKLNIVSEYYFYKNAYPLWSILLITTFFGIICFIKKYRRDKKTIILYIAIYLFLFIIITTYITYLTPALNIYKKNEIFINQKENITNDDINMLNYIYENNLLNKNENNVLFICEYMQEAWIRAIFGYRNRLPLEKVNHIQYIEKWNKGEIQYLVCFEESNMYRKLKDYCKIEEEPIFETKNLKLYKKY